MTTYPPPVPLQFRSALPPGVVTEAVEPLLEAHGGRIARSVDIFEVAVLLEASGVSDRVARDKYGAVDVIDLAWSLHQMVSPDDEAEVAPEPASVDREAPHDWYGSTGLALLRGGAFVFAGVMVMVIVEVVAHPWTGEIVLASSVLSTGLMGWMSHLGHTVTQRVPREQRGPALRSLYIVGLLIALVVGNVVGILIEPAVGVVAAVPILYAVSTVIVLVLGHHWLFVVTLLPGGLVSVVHLLAPDSGPTARTCLVISGTGLLILFATATAAVMRSGPVGNGVGRVDLRASRKFGYAGLLLALVVAATLFALASMPATETATGRQWFLLALPFYIPLVVAEVLVITYRRRVARAIATSMSPAVVAEAAHRAAGRLWLSFALIGIASIGATWQMQPIRNEGLALMVSAAFLMLSGLLVASLLCDEGVERVRRDAFVTLVISLTALGLAGPGANSLRMSIVVFVLLAVGVGAIAGAVIRRSGSLPAYRWVI